MKFLGFVILFLICSCTSSASHIQLTGLNQNEKIILEAIGSGNQCEEKIFPQWSILFNIIPISSPKQSEIFPNSKRSYRFYEKWTTTDILISIPLAYLLTVTRRSLVVESCQTDKMYFLSSADFDKEVKKQVDVEVKKQLEQELKKSLESKVEELIEERMKSGDEISRKIEEIQKGRESLKGTVRDRIVLYNGKVYEGELIIPKEKTDYVEFNILVPKKVPIKIKKTDIKEPKYFQ